MAGHFVATERVLWNMTLSIMHYEKHFDDMVYLQKKDKSSALRFKVLDKNISVEEDGMKSYGDSFTITWEVDSAGDGKFKGGPVSLINKSSVLSTKPNKGTVTLFTVNGRFLQSFESRTQFLKSKATLPKGVYLLKDLMSVKKISIQ